MDQNTTLCNLIIPNKIYGEINLKEVQHKPIIVTHDGRFHADDVLAVAMLLQLPEFRDAYVVRTRKQELIDLATIVVDVGQTYDVTKKRFDHHQKTFNEFYNVEYSNITCMSSAGLIFKYYGDLLLSQVFNITLPEDVAKCKEELYRSFILAIDAIDNGVSNIPKTVEPLYVITTDLSTRISRLNDLNRLENFDGDNVSSNLFIEAVSIVLKELTELVNFVRKVWLPTYKIIIKSINERYRAHSSGRVLQLSTNCPYSSHLYTAEKELNILDEFDNNSLIPKGILFVIYPYDEVSWRVRAIAKSQYTFELRLQFPERFCGASTQDIQKELPNVQFVHRNGFIAGASAREGVLQLIDLTLQEANI